MKVFVFIFFATFAILLWKHFVTNLMLYTSSIGFLWQPAKSKQKERIISYLMIAAATAVCWGSLIWLALFFWPWTNCC